MEVAVVLSVLSLIVSVVSVIVAYLVAMKYGDMAAVKATRKFHEEDVARARVAALQSLRNEVVRIRKVAEYYQTSDPSGVPQMPVAAFETAFVSGSSGLAASRELMDSVCDYVVLADHINSLVDLWQGPCIARPGCSGVTFSSIRTACNSLPEILDRLDECLQREFEEAQRRLE